MISLSLAIAADWRDQPPLAVVRTQRSSDAIVGCLSRAWRRRGGHVSYVPGEGSAQLDLSFNNGAFGLVTIANAVISTDGQTRVVSFRAKGANASSRLRREISTCSLPTS